MKHNDPELSQELRKAREKYISNRWEQLYDLSKGSAEQAIKYLFSTNAGGAVAVLAYLGSSTNNSPNAKIALCLFFSGLLFIGFYKAYMVHHAEDIFFHYAKSVNEYHEGKIDWDQLTKADDDKLGNSKTPYILAYLAFGAFIGGCISGATAVF